MFWRVNGLRRPVHLRPFWFEMAWSPKRSVSNVMVVRNGVIGNGSPKDTAFSLGHASACSGAGQKGRASGCGDVCQPKHLSTASEVFLTETTVKVLPVVHIDGHAIGAGVPGPLSRTFVSALGKL